MMTIQTLHPNTVKYLLHQAKLQKSIKQMAHEMLSNAHEKIYVPKVSKN